jgi:hypothetical protein
VVTAAFLDRALVLTDTHIHLLQHNAVGAMPRYV